MPLQCKYTVADVNASTGLKCNNVMQCVTASVCLSMKEFLKFEDPVGSVA